MHTQTWGFLVIRNIMSKMIRATELARLMELKPYFFRDNHHRKTLVGVRMRPDAAYYNIEFAKCLAKRFAHKSKIPIEVILRKIDEYDP
jgi:hypothetical protein